MLQCQGTPVGDGAARPRHGHRSVSWSIGGRGGGGQASHLVHLLHVEVAGKAVGVRGRRARLAQLVLAQDVVADDLLEDGARKLVLRPRQLPAELLTCAHGIRTPSNGNGRARHVSNKSNKGRP